MPVYFHQSKNLPSEYQEVEYIQSSWTQWIDTWYIVNPDTIVDVDFQYTSISHNNMILWVWSDSNQNEVIFCLYPGIIDSSNRNYYSFATADSNQQWQEVRYHTSIQNDTVRRRHILKNWIYEIYNSNWTLAERKTSSCTISKRSNHSMWLFCWWWNDTNSWNLKSKWKLYSCIIKEWASIKKYFVPCYRKVDGVIWLYDLINLTFHTNIWTWTFTKWPNVNNDHIIENLSRCYLWDQLLVGWECWCYTVNSNTLAYFPFKKDILDHWPSWLTLTQVWTYTQQNWYVDTKWFTFTKPNDLYTFTLMWRVKDSNVNTISVPFMDYYDVSSNYYWFSLQTSDQVTWTWSDSTTPWYMRIEVLSWWRYWRTIRTSFQYPDYDKRFHLAIVMTSSTCTVYTNWVQRFNQTWISRATSNNKPISLWCSQTSASSEDMSMSEIIFENRWRDSNEVLSYVNCSKWNYWY